MPRYRVQISEGISEIVDAESEQEAKNKVRSIIATGAVSPFYDKLNFDYETGIRGKFQRRVDEGTEREGSLRNLRAQLARAETAQEQDMVMSNFVGSSGFIRNTKGQMALTPEGLEELGLPIQTRTLSDGSEIKLNTIVDENDFGLQTGDLADFAGIAGPIAGAIAAMSPQLRVIKALTSLFGGRARFARTIAAGAGSAVGKAGEEALDLQEGFQLQERDDLKNLFGGEFLFGFAGQGLGELVGMGYRLFLGRNAPTQDLRLNNQMAKGRSATDILKLDAELGKEATERQIAKAVRDGKVKQFDFKGIASQATLGAKLPGRLQDISEQVLVNVRDKETAAYLRADLANLLEEIGGENALLQKSISDATKGTLDEQVQASLQALRTKEQNVTQQLRKLLDDVVEDAIEVGNYGNAPGRTALGETIKENLGRARGLVMTDLGKKYRELDKMFVTLTSTQGKTGIAKEQAVLLDRVIRNIINKNIDDSFDLIKQHKEADFFWRVSNKEEIDNSIVTKIEKALQDFQRSVADPGSGVSLQQVRNAYSKLHTISRDTLEASPERKLIIDIMRKLDDQRVSAMTGQVKSEKYGNSIFTQLEEELVDKFNKDLAATINLNRKRTGTIFDDEIEIQQKDLKILNDAVEQLRIVNKTAAERMAPFDRLQIKKVISDSRKGAHDADEIYKKVILGGERSDLDAIFAGLRDYDAAMIKANKPAKAVTEATLKSQLKKRLFADAFRASTDVVDESINFTQFAKEIKKFERDYPGKLDSLFTDSATGKNTAELVRVTIDQINKIGPRIKPQEIKNLVNDFTTNIKGLSASDQGLAFVQGLKQLAKASDERLKLEANRAISDLPLKGIDETVNIIFRPNANANIGILKETVSPEVFTSIQQASMQKLLSKSIDINGKGRITDLFKAGNLKTALDSYGDETLEAMFGKELTQGLRNFQRSVDTITKQEAGRGGAAGGLVAAGIGASLALNPIAVLPTVLSLAVARKLFASPTAVQFFSKTDKGSIMTLIDMTEQALRQTLIRELGMEAEEAGNVAGGIMAGAYDKAGIEDIINEAKGLVREAITEAEDFEQEARQQFRTTQAPRTNIPLPDIEGVSLPTLDPVSRDRVEFDEQLFGRPSRIA